MGTPIGNLEDITFRALKTLRNVDLIAAEDTRHTLELLNHFEIKNKLVRYDEHTKIPQGEFLISQMQEGKNIALVSDAGLPGIADPGADLAKKCIEKGIQVVPVPGANAALTALIASGFIVEQFFFAGFLPKVAKNRQEELENIKNIYATLIFYEAPHRIKEVLQDIYKIFGERKLCLARELTKIHEEFWFGSLSEGIKYLEAKDEVRGEFVIILAPPEKQNIIFSIEELLGKVKILIENGMDKKEALSEIAKKYKVPKRELYNKMIE